MYRSHLKLQNIWLEFLFEYLILFRLSQSIKVYTEEVENRHYKWAYSKNTIERNNSEVEDGISNRKDDLMLMISKFSPSGYKYKSISRNQQNEHYDLYSNGGKDSFPKLHSKTSISNEANQIYKGTYY